MKSISVCTIIIVVGAVTAAQAIVIDPTFTGFDSTQQEIVWDAITQWTTLIGGSTHVQVDFVADSSVPLASTFVQATDDGAQGRPTSATVHVNTGAYNWTTGSPADGLYDGMRGMMHELGHAAGFADAYCVNGDTGQPILNDFGRNVVTLQGNAFYDLNHDGAYSPSVDFDLADNDHSHAPVGSSDLMQPYAPKGIRLVPTEQHAGVLTDAYGYDVVLNGLGGTKGYGRLAMAGTNDDSSGRVGLPFEINLFGHTYASLFVNNNGNLTFDSAVGEGTPSAFPCEDQPMIAPFWADVDTRALHAGNVYVASPGQDVVVVTWNDVGYASGHADKQNDFQVVLRNRPDQGPGTFDIEFRYDRLEWTTGDASGGSGGLGGTAAQAGYDAGDGIHSLNLPGSGTSAVLNLTGGTNTASNVNIEGLWIYSVRDGNPPGVTADNPLLPVATGSGWRFDFSIGRAEDPVFIDPLAAIGYDYRVDAGASFSSVLLPTLGDNLYDLWLWDSGLGLWADSGIDLTGGSRFDFQVGGLNMFRILGIEAASDLDPYDTGAFVTGLWFTDPGVVTVYQIPILAEGYCPVPSPGALVLACMGLAAVPWVRRRPRRG
jgi:hypothetical protein